MSTRRLADVTSPDQCENNFNNIKGLAFYHEIRWSLIFFITHIEYYAPKVGLVKEDLLNEKDGHLTVAMELVAFTPGAP